MKIQNNIIVALDFPTPENAFRLVEDLDSSIDWYKIGPTLFTQHGHDIIRFLHRKNKKIFVDLKLHDTPRVVTQTLRQFVDLGVSFATVHCLGGRTMLTAAAQACRGSQLKLLGVTLLTSHTTEDVRELGLGETEDGDLISIVQKYVSLAIQSRLSGVLCSPHEVAATRNISPPGFLIVTPGVRLPDQSIFDDDQMRFASPGEALAWGSDYLVMGRPFMQTRNPDAVLTQLREDLERHRSL